MMDDTTYRGTARCFLTMMAMLGAMATPAADPPPEDLLSFAHGAVPIEVGGDAATTGTSLDQALQVIDGDVRGFVVTPKPGVAATSIVFAYELPVPTVFESFAIPNVLETPSPAQTFFQTVTVSGSSAGPEGPFQELAAGTLATHSKKGETTELTVSTRTPVRWVRVALRGGIQVMGDKTFFEFSELIGHGTQEAAALSTAFAGRWQGRSVKLELKQEGVRVDGCYDDDGTLSGTVSGNLLHATGKTHKAGIPSTFVLAVGADGNMFGVRSTNGAPFKLYAAAAAPALRTECSGRAVAPLGCGAVIHGIRFDYDSAAIREESAAHLDALFDGLRASPATAITVLGHTSNEGSDAYNDSLSQRRAEAVAAALVSRGLAASRIAAAGQGERQPIADNESEIGRALNRRVEISCR